MPPITAGLLDVVVDSKGNTHIKVKSNPRDEDLTRAGLINDLDNSLEPQPSTRTNEFKKKGHRTWRVVDDSRSSFVVSSSSGVLIREKARLPLPKPMHSINTPSVPSLDRPHLSPPACRIRAWRSWPTSNRNKIALINVGASTRIYPSSAVL